MIFCLICMVSATDDPLDGLRGAEWVPELQHSDGWTQYEPQVRTNPPKISIEISGGDPIFHRRGEWYEQFAQDERNERRSPFPADQAPADVVVFTVEPAGDGDFTDCWQSWTAFFQWLNMRVVKIRPQHLLDDGCGDLLRRNGVKVFVMPGGQTQRYAMFPMALQNIHEFLGAGGLYVGSCGGCGFLTGMSHRKLPSGHRFIETTPGLGMLGRTFGPVLEIGAMTPRRDQAYPVDGTQHQGDPMSIFVRLSDGAYAPYGSGGIPLENELPEDAHVLQYFEGIRTTLTGDDRPIAALHFHGENRNVLAYVYHPEHEVGLPGPAADLTGAFARHFLQDDHGLDLPLVQLRSWQQLGRSVLAAIDEAPELSREEAFVPEDLRYVSPATGVVWMRVEGNAHELVQERSAAYWRARARSDMAARSSAITTDRAPIPLPDRDHNGCAAHRDPAQGCEACEALTRVRDSETTLGRRR